MKRNVGQVDRLIRLIVAAICFYFIYGVGLSSELITITLLAYGLLNLITAVLGFCPFYFVANINTCRAKTTTKR